MLKKKTNSLDLNNPAFYNNRELSWLAFNKRVLEEALDERNPLLERCKFLAIFSSNLDEFFMVRVAGLKDQVKAGVKSPENKAGLTPKQQLSEIAKINHVLVDSQYKMFTETLLPNLRKENIEFASLDQLNNEQLTYLETYFDDIVLPVLTPLAIDAYRPFPMLVNKSINLAVVIKDQWKDTPEGEKLEIVQVPRGLNRFVEIRNNNSTLRQFVILEDLLCHFIYKLFVGFHVESTTQFRITRNADLTIQEEGARDLLKEIEEELKMRKWGCAVRLEVNNHFVDNNILNYLLDELEIHDNDVYFVNGPLDLTFLFHFYDETKKEKDHLVYMPRIPQPPKDLMYQEDLFETLSKKDVLLHHPYESFEPVIDLVRNAVEDPNVLAIKQTLYRVSQDSPIIEALMKAAENGKQVLVLVELKARFDEEHNVLWAKELEKAGCHVIYGMTHLKTHSKITLIVKRNKDKIERFIHLGTGNYNELTAKIYTDLGLMTSNSNFGLDTTNFFNYLSGDLKKPTFHHLVIAPFDIRDHFIHLIDKEMEYHRKFSNGRIIAKMNSLTEKTFIIKLYEASQAGVKIDLIVRGICCLRPGIKGVSENIRVRSIVGRYLEHSRIYYFHHNGEEKIYLSSADWMTRNISKRVEISFPIMDKQLKERIKQVLIIMLNDNVKARIQNNEGNYYCVERKPMELEINSQLVLFNMAYPVEDDQE
ncbi:RNA degradosome polyphosphate kinase [Alteribacillus sp. JSM 102045]|uniref:RNA degradosome polyphosphate kinase n=1 Tax=Alteribacillus sp. JSM 102045 TaxID=1562101 RepID=UPI0035C126AD